MADNGFLLVNSLFYKEAGNPKIIKEVSNLFNLKVDETCDYEYWNSLFEQKFKLIIEGVLDNTCSYHIREDVVRNHVRDSLNRSKKFQRLSVPIQDAFFERLLKIKLKANENHRYLDARAQVWKKK